MNNDEIQSLPLIYNEETISFPLDQNAFKDFIVSLLGKPETIEGTVKGAFEIDFKSFENLNTQLDNRISTQNLSSLLAFEAKLFFNDGSAMTFNGLESFRNYEEMRPLICNGFFFTWTYLVKFHNKSAAERQEVSIFSLEQDEISIPYYSDILFNIFVPQLPPEIKYIVECSDRGWGIEIAELLKNCIHSLREQSGTLTNLRKRFIQNSQEIYSALFVSLMCWSIFVVNRIASIYSSDICRENLNNKDILLNEDILLDDKLEFAINLLSSCYLTETLSESLFSSFVGQFVAWLILTYLFWLLVRLLHELIKLPTYRFILFTPQSNKKRNAYFQRIIARKSFWIYSFFVALAVSILANYIFGFLSN